MLVLITNASKPQTKQDLLNVCCCAEGEQISFDYRFCWIADDVINKETEKLADQEALIVYYNPIIQHPDNPTEFPFDCSIPDEPHPPWSSRLEFTFYPLRYAKVLSVQQRESSRTFELELKDWFRYKADRRANEESIKSKQVAFRQTVSQLPKPGRVQDSQARGEKKTNLVAFGEDGPFQLKAQEKSEPITSLSFVATLAGLDDCILMCPVRAQEKFALPLRPFHSATLIDGVPALPGLRRVQVASGSTHLLTMFVRRGPKASPRLPTVIIESTVASIVGPVSRQCNGGQVVLFEFLFSSQVVERDAFVVIQAPATAGGTGGTSEVIAPEFAVHIKVSPVRGTILLLAFLSLVALVCASVDLAIMSRVIDGAAAQGTAPAVASGAAVTAYWVAKATAVAAGIAAWWIAATRGLRKIIATA